MNIERWTVYVASFLMGGMVGLALAKVIGG